MINKVKNYIKDKNLIDKNSKVILAFSYGIDSRVLLDILISLGYEVVLAHVNHKHRIESELEEKEATKLAKNLGIRIYIHHLDEDKSKNFHDDAHHKRYSFFKDIAIKENTNIIATAHHKDDNAETIIGNIISGSNLYGYSGISPLLIDDGFRIIRPLMSLTKNEIKKYQQNRSLEYFEDSSNGEDYYRRNRIRHHIIPHLLDENENALSNISNYSEILLESFNYIRSISTSFLSSKNEFELDDYKNHDIAIRHDILCYLLENNDIERSFNLIKDIDKSLISNKPQLDITLKGGYTLKKRYNRVFLDNNVTSKGKYYELWENTTIIDENRRFYFTEILPPKGVKYITLCYNQLVFPLILRTRKDGDKVDMSYGTKKLKDLFIDIKIEREKRDTILLLENDNEILWIIDYAKSKKLTEMKKTGNIYLVNEEYTNEE